MVKGFQHSQPQSVYRQKNRAITGIMIPLSLALFGFYVYRFVTRPNEDGFLSIVWLIIMVNSIHTFLRTKLTLSPTGISVIMGGRMATAWSNVEGIQLIPLGYLIKRQVPCLVLREPLPGKQLLGVLGVSAALKGRIIPIHPAAWEREFTLQDEIYGYLKANSVIGNELAVPIDFASISQRQKQLTWRITVAMICLGLFVMVIAAVVLVRVI